MPPRVPPARRAPGYLPWASIAGGNGNRTYHRLHELLTCNSERGDRIDIEALRDEAAGALAGAVELRRTLHRWPEVGNDLPITQEQVLAAIEPLPLDVTAARDHERASPRC